MSPISGSWAKQGVSRVGQFNRVSGICLRPTPVSIIEESDVWYYPSKDNVQGESQKVAPLRLSTIFPLGLSLLHKILYTY